MLKSERHLNSNIEIHKFNHPFKRLESWMYLNSNIEIHK